MKLKENHIMSERTTMTKEVKKDGNKEVSFRKTWDKNGIHNSIEVRKVEGGYIISESKYGTPKDGGENAEYIDERSERVSTKNPFEEKKEEEKKEDTMFSFIDKPLFE